MRGDSPLTPRVWSVSALVHAIADTLQVRFATVAVRGEISGFTRAASGHAYFTLKDDNAAATMRCAMFRRALQASTQGGYEPRSGQLVEAVGQVAVYEARGELQLIIEQLRPAGAGALYEQFLQLKAKLESEGLFDPSRKRAMPQHPRRIAVVTSTAAAALQDVLNVLRRRAPHLEVIVVPTLVQGAEAPPQIVQALAQAQALHRSGHHLDMVLLCRGGGSIEDLWAFNDERVVRAIAACTLPVLCGVGHETDVTLADFAADVRAPTPSAAAELACRDAADAARTLQALSTQLHLRTRRLLDQQAQRLDRAAARLSRPGASLLGGQAHLRALDQAMRTALTTHCALSAQRLAHAQQRLQRAVPERTRHTAARLEALAANLQALSPERVLERGYAWLTLPDGRLVQSVADVAVGDALSARLQDGQLGLRVADVQPPTQANAPKP